MKSLSIRSRIQFWFAGLCGAVMLAFAVAVVVHSGNAAARALDERLALRADTLVGLCEQEDERLVCELEPAMVQQFVGALPRRGFLVQTLPDRLVIASGGSLETANLPSHALFAAGEGRQFTTLASEDPVRRLESVCQYESGEPGEGRLLRVVTEEATAPLERERRELVLALGLGAVTALLGVGIAGWFLARRIVDPLATLAAGAELVQAGRPGSLPRSGSGDEVDQLATTIERAMVRLQDAHGRQARFTADAAHELRTPLAIIRTQAEVALHRPRDAEAYRAGLLEILTGARRMTDTLDSLLLLARADAGTLDDGEEVVDLGEVARAVISARTPSATGKHLHLVLQATAPAPVRGCVSLLWILVDNLVSNAIRYSDGPGEISIRTGALDGGSSLVVTDPGIGIAEERIPFLFERFFRADPARSRSAGGSGLGLAIVRAIAESHRAACRVDSQLGRGSRFEVVFPPASKC